MKIKRKEILEAEKLYQQVIREYGYENWANDNAHDSPESIVLMVLLKKVCDIDKKMKGESEK